MAKTFNVLISSVGRRVALFKMLQQTLCIRVL